MRLVLRIVAAIAILAAAAAAIHTLCWQPYRCNKTAAALRDASNVAYEQKDVLLARGNLEQILRGLEHCPGNVYLRVLAGQNFETLGRIESAAEMYTQALRYHRRPELFVRLGSAQHQSGLTEEGIANAARGAMFAPNILEKLPPSILRQRAYERISAVMSASVTIRNADFSQPSVVGPRSYEGEGGPSAARYWNVYATSRVRTELVPSTRRPGAKMLHVIVEGPNSGIVQSWGRAGTGPNRARTDVWLYLVRGAVQSGSGATANAAARAVTRQTGVWEHASGFNVTCPVADTIIFSYEGPAEFYVDEVTITPVEGECFR